MKVDFIHVGYHKTASTWFQVVGFPAHTGLVMFNDSRTPLDRYFMQHFVETDDMTFDRQAFEAGFDAEIRRHLETPGAKITGICEENLSGHFWNGCGQSRLAERIKEVFGDTRIIITVRHQLDMLASLYANYVKSGGTKSVAALLADDNMFGERVFAKLRYDPLVRHYVRLFGRDRVLVICFEEFVRSPNSAFNRMLEFVGAGPIELPSRAGVRRVNVRYSVPAEWLLRWMNFTGMRWRVTDKALAYMDRYLFWNRAKRSRNSMMQFVPPAMLAAWQESNRRLMADMEMDLQRYGYPL